MPGKGKPSRMTSNQPEVALFLSQEAADDLRDILQYTLERWGPSQVRAYQSILDQALSKLQHSPKLGRKRPELSADYRSLLAGQHVVIYRLTESTLYVVRILHQSGDIQQVFASEDEP